MKILKIIVVLFLINLVINKICECPSKPNIVEEFKPNSNFTLKNIVINGVDYGLPYLLKDLILLNTKIPSEKTTSTMKNKCPLGFEILSSQDLLILAEGTAGYDILTNFGFEDKSIIISATKSFPDLNNGGNNDAWKFDSLTINKSTKTLEFGNTSTYFSSGFTICKELSNVAISTGQYDLAVGKDYSISILSPNIKSQVWSVEGVISHSPELKLSSNESGCKYVEVFALNAVGTETYSCNIFYFFVPKGSDGNVTLDYSKFEKLNTEKKASRSKNVFFNKPDVVQAAADDGSFYVAYSTDDEVKQTVVLNVSNDMKVKTSYNIELNTHPLSICIIPGGFALFLIKADDSSYSYVVGYSIGSNGSAVQTFKRIIMNNGELPTSSNNQSLIFKNDKGEILFGMNAMYRTHNGKLAYGGGRIALIFAHYNHFGMKNGKRDDHTGDTFVTMDVNGENADYAWSWGASHSLIQSIIYDGRYFVTASLGDIYPENIRVCFIKPNDYQSKSLRSLNSVCKDIVEKGKIPGAGNGDTCGNLGGLFFTNNRYFVSFSRRNCELPGFNGSKTSDSNGEIGIVEFKFINESGKDIISVTKHLNIGDANAVIQLRSQKVGNNIFTLIAKSNSPPVDKSSVTHSYSANDIMEYIVTDLNGVKIVDRTELVGFDVPLSDDLAVLKDGSIVWGIPNRENNLLWIFKSQTPTYIDPYKVETPKLIGDSSSSSSMGTTSDKDKGKTEMEVVIVTSSSTQNDLFTFRFCLSILTLLTMLLL